MNWFKCLEESYRDTESTVKNSKIRSGNIAKSSKEIGSIEKDTKEYEGMQKVEKF